MNFNRSLFVSGVLVLFFLYIHTSFGQSDSLKQLFLSEVVVRSTGDSYNLTEDSLYITTKDYSPNLLRQQTGVIIRSYGLNGLATLSHRGLSSDHIQLKWGAVPLHSAMNGQSDLSILPTFLLENISVNVATDTTGSSFAGVGVQIQTPSDVQRVGLYANCTSFGSQLYGSSFKIKVGANSKINNFIEGRIGNTSYRYQENNTIYRTPSAPIKSIQGVHQWVFQKKYGQTIESGLWWYYHKRWLTPSRVVPFSTSLQEDIGVRTYVELSKEKERSSYKSQFYIQREGLIFEDTLSAIYSENHFTRIGVTNRWQKQSKKSTYSIGIPSYIEIVNSSSYIKSRWRWHPYIERIINNTNSFFKFYLGMEGINHSYQGWNGKFAYSYSIDKGKRLSGTLDVSHTIRVPNFNDLYWPGSGNELLVPEKIISLTHDILYKHSTTSKKSRVKISPYVMLINDRILWSPQSNGVWTPQQFKRVYSYGVDFQGKATIILKNIVFNFSSILKHNTIFEWNDQNNEKTSLLFLPRFQGIHSVTITNNTWSIQTEMDHLSKRNTRTDGISPMKEYCVFAFLVNKSFIFNNVSNVNVTCTLKNLLNSYYENMPLYPMPGRMFELKLKYFYL